MRGSLRAAAALALHIGFFVLPVGVVLGLAAVSALAFRTEAREGVQALAATVVVGAVVFIGMRSVLRPRDAFCGVPIDRGSQPQLWRMVDDLAEDAGLAALDQIRVTSEPAAKIRDDTRLLGLRSRARALEIGLPLLVGLNVTELQAAVACEIGQLVSRGRIGRVTERSVVAVKRVATDRTGGPMTWLFGGYARLFVAVAGRDTAEFAADAIAVRMVGKRAAITALRKVIALEYGWRCYSDEYLAMAVAVGHTPELIPGFRSFLDHPQRKKQLAEHAKRTIAEQLEFDDGPTTRIRVETMKRLRSEEQEINDRPAFTVLRSPKRTLPSLEDKLMIEGLGPRLPWPELARAAGAAQVAQQAGVLSSAVVQSGVSEDSTIGGVLAAIHRGQGAELVNPALNPGLDPDRVPEAAVDTLTDLLGAAVVDALVRAGQAVHELDWGGPSIVRLTANGQPLDPDRLVRPAVADPRLVPGLHRALVNLGVPLNHSQPPAEEPEPGLAGIVTAVSFSDGLYELLVTDRGLLLVPNRSSTAKRVLAALWSHARRSEYQQLADLSAAGVDQLRDEPGTLWVDSRDVAAASWVQQANGWLLELDLYLDDYSVSSLDTAGINPDEEGRARLRLRSTADSEEHDDPYGGLGELMGARMQMEEARE